MESASPNTTVQWYPLTVDLAVEHDDADEIELDNGDTLAERLEDVDLEVGETRSTGETHERLNR